MGCDFIVLISLFFFRMPNFMALLLGYLFFVSKRSKLVDKQIASGQMQTEFTFSVHEGRLIAQKLVVQEVVSIADSSFKSA